MKYKTQLIIILIAVAAAVYLIFIKSPEEIAQPKQSEITNEFKTQMITDDRPPITINVTPIQFGKNEDSWKFNITFDTHSGSLDHDLMETTRLSDDKGGLYKPISWEGPRPGGHHREGLLVFKAINPMPDYIELKIKDVGGIAERSFKWVLK